MSPDLGFNTAVSFTTNTNWQSYTPETTLQLFCFKWLGLTVPATSASYCLAILIALVRGFARQSIKTIGNFWVDMTRATLYVLMPIAIIAALVSLLAGCHSESASVHSGDHNRRGKADHCARARRVAGSNQDAPGFPSGGGFLQFPASRAPVRESHSIYKSFWKCF